MSQQTKSGTRRSPATAPTRRTAGRPPRISHEKILAQARSIPAERITMPLIASRLKVRTAALYYHFPSRDALLAELSARLVADFELKPADPSHWRSWLQETAMDLLRFMLSHPVILQVESWNRIAKVGVPLLETALETLEEAGFSADAALKAWSVVANLTYAQARILYEVPAMKDEGWRKRSIAETRAGLAKDFPRTSAALAPLHAWDPMKSFSEILQWLIALLPEPARPRKRRAPRTAR